VSEQTNRPNPAEHRASSSTLTTYLFGGQTAAGGVGCRVVWVVPAALVFAADAGSFAALSGEDVGMAGILVAPTQVVLHRLGEDSVVAVIRACAVPN
jgi:hypothetical protein